MPKAHFDLLLYVVHAGFWASFGSARVLTRGPSEPDGSGETPTASTPRTAPHSRMLLGLHMLAFLVMYLGVGNSVLPDRVPHWFAGQRIVGTVIIGLGAALMAWAISYFSSWRFRAKLDEGHQLATGGPFRLLRHPLYMGLNLLALGTAFWAPTPAVWAGFVFMVLGSDLRGRAEETLLTEAFGSTYTEYCRRTKRFIPGVY